MSVNDIRREPTTDLFEVKQGESVNSCTFIFGNEDHTLGNSLRYILIQKKETVFCGYSVPHPYEPKMNLRLQTSGSDAVSVLKSGLKELELVADRLDEVFAAALTQYAK